MKWSYSTHRQMRQCPRQLVLAHVIAHHSPKHAERREAFILKQLQHPSAWHGSLVHHTLSRTFIETLRTRRPFDWRRLERDAHALAERQFLYSGAKRYREPNVTKIRAGPDFCALTDHDRGQPVSPLLLDTARTTISRCLANLKSQEEFLAYLRSGSSFDAERTLHFRIDGIGLALTATPDVQFRRRNGQLTIVDWKIGDSDTAEYSRQLLVYAVAATHQGWPTLDPEQIDLVEANLLKNAVRNHSVTRERLEETEDFIFRSAAELEALLLDVSYVTVKIEDYDVARSPQTCAFCNFHTVCVGARTTQSDFDALVPEQGSLF